MKIFAEAVKYKELKAVWGSIFDCILTVRGNYTTGLTRLPENYYFQRLG